MRNTSAIARSSFLALLLGFSFANCSTREEKTKEISIKGEVAPKSKVHTVVIERMQFSPSDVYVNKGDTVMWVNKDMVEHNVTEATNKNWSSSAMKTGTSWKMAVLKNEAYFCSIHPVMKGKITIK